jgi:oxygen-independent coproporphyrinogen-3 oxidase
MLSLRTADGLDLDAMQRQYGDEAVGSVLPVLQGLQRRGLVRWLGEAGAQQQQAAVLAAPGGAAGSGHLGVVALTDPEGLMLSNDVISDVFAALMP